MSHKLLIILVLGAPILFGCAGIQFNLLSIKGSGRVVSEPRKVVDFTAIDLEGSADVQVAFGTSESLVIEAEDNILPRIETVVQDHRLIIRTKSGAIVIPTRPIRVSVTLKSLDSVTLGGSGNITVPELKADSFKAALDGSGNITVGGAVDLVNISLDGSGNVNCGSLKARAASVALTGSGNISVYARDSLDATLSGSGNIRYAGNPPNINKTVSGSGSIRGQD